MFKNKKNIKALADKSEVVDAEVLADFSGEAAAKKKKLAPLTIMYLMVAIIALILVVLLGFRIAAHMGVGSNAEKNKSIVYVVNSKELKFKNQLLEESAVINDNFNIVDSNKISDNICVKGNSLLYLDISEETDIGTLYLRNIDKERSSYGDEKGVVIDENVKSGKFMFMDKKTAVYVTEDGALCIKGAKGTKKILDDNVMDIIGVVQENKIYYTKKVNNLVSLYTFDAKDKGSRGTAVDTAVTDILAFNESDDIIYATRGESVENPYTVRVWDGKSSRILCENASREFFSSNKKNDIFYARKIDERMDPELLFSDMYVTDDEKIEEPNKDSYYKEVTNIFGTTKTVFDSAAYTKDKKAYDEKVKRDEIRAAMDEINLTNSGYNIYYRTGNSETKVDHQVTEVIAENVDTGEAVYRKRSFNPKERIEIAELSGPEEMEKLFAEALQENKNFEDEVYYAKIGLTPYSFYIDGKNKLADLVLGEKGYMYYTTEDAKGNNTLWGIATGDGSVSPAEIDKNILSLEFSGGNVFYYKGSNAEKASLYKLEAGKASRITDNAAANVAPNSTSTGVYFYRNYDEVKKMGDLYRYVDSIKLVAEDVYAYNIKTKNFIYCLTDYDKELGGDLVLANGKGRVTEIEKNVNSFYPSTTAE